MQTAITSIEGVKDWFLANKRPFFTLYLMGSSEKVIYRNTEITDMDVAWAEMERQIMLQSQGGLAALKIYATDKQNNPNGVTTYIRIFGGNQYGGAVQMPGIAGTGGGILGINSKDDLDRYIAEKQEIWSLRRDIEDMRAAQTAEVAKWERVLDKISESPQLAGIARIVVDRVTAAFLPSAPAVAGAQPAPATDNSAPANQSVPDDEYEEKLNQELDTLETETGMQAPAVLKKLNELRRQNPEMFNALMQNG